MEDCGGGWWRCWLVSRVDAASEQADLLFLVTDSSGNQSFTGDGVSGVYLWGAQFEQATLPNPYIPTVASPVGNGASAYSQSFRVYLFDSSSGSPPTFGSYNVSWFAKGY